MVKNYSGFQQEKVNSGEKYFIEHVLFVYTSQFSSPFWHYHTKSKIICKDYFEDDINFFLVFAIIANSYI